MTESTPDTETLLRRSARGDRRASGELFERHRQKLRRMIAVRLDRRLASRVDPSDIVQDTLTQASQLLPAFHQREDVAFYPWLRSIALNTLTDHFRRHVVAQRRSVLREDVPELTDASVSHLVNRLATSASSPSKLVNARETQRRVRAALELLTEQEREILILKYLEEMKTREIAVVLGIDEGSVRRRHRLAAQRLATLLDSNNDRSIES